MANTKKRKGLIVKFRKVPASDGSQAYAGDVKDDGDILFLKLLYRDILYLL